MKNLCFQIAVYFHLLSVDSELKRVESIMRRAFRPSASSQDYGLAILELERLQKLLKEKHSRKVLRWVEESPRQSGLYGRLQDLKGMDK